MKGTLVVSLDFELFWGMIGVCPLEDYKENVLGGRKAIPELLEIFRKYGIHATWATVGFMFARNYQELLSYFPEEGDRPTYADRKNDPYKEFANIGANEDCFFAPELIRLIDRTPGQEIGSHTFSHFYCREMGQTVEQFREDMRAAKIIAEDQGYEVTSVVLPRNQCEPEYTRVLLETGFTAYRDEENDWIYNTPMPRLLKRICLLADTYFPLTGHACFTPKNEGGLWNITGSQTYRTIFPPLIFLEKRKLRRIKKQMLHAAKTGKTYHLWWHPHNLGLRREAHLRQMEEIFSYYQELKETYGMQSLNMREAAEACGTFGI